jgi:hypothetical protein
VVSVSSVVATHLVQFYSGAEQLAEGLSSLFADSLMRGEAVVVVAAPDHRDALDSALSDAGVNLATECRSGRYIPLDAEEALGKFMTPAGPDRELFRSTIGRTIERARRHTGSVNAYGEMVGVLAERDDLAAALELETLWHEVLQRQPLRLLCGYPRDVVGDVSPAFDSICATHDGVLVSRAPTEPPFSATLDLPLVPNAAAAARRAARDVLSAWPTVDSTTLADAGLVVSELVGAAARRTSTRVSLALALDDGQVLIAVTDAEGRRPSHVPESDLAAGGRSFAVLTRVAQSWGVESLGERTRIWAKLPPASG